MKAVSWVARQCVLVLATAYDEERTVKARHGQDTEPDRPLTGACSGHNKATHELLKLGTEGETKEGHEIHSRCREEQPPGSPEVEQEARGAGKEDGEETKDRDDPCNVGSRVALELMLLPVDLEKAHARHEAVGRCHAQGSSENDYPGPCASIGVFDLLFLAKSRRDGRHRTRNDCCGVIVVASIVVVALGAGLGLDLGFRPARTSRS